MVNKSLTTLDSITLLSQTGTWTRYPVSWEAGKGGEIFVLTPRILNWVSVVLTPKIYP